MTDQSTFQDIVDADRRYLWHPFTQMQNWQETDQLIIESGQGALLRDVNGNEYLDGCSSLWANVHGHRHPEIDRRVKEQLDRIAHSTLLGLGNVPAARLARRLVEIAPAGLDHVFFSDDGSTAVEIAVKVAYQYWQQRQQPRTEKPRLLSFENGYHGDTLGAVSAGGIDLFHAVYRPLLVPALRAYHPYCYRCRYELEWPGCRMRCIESVANILDAQSNEIFAVIIEPLVQGAGGMITAPPGFLSAVRELTRRHDVLLITDEVATGFGRTGRMFACEHETVSPDIMVLGKGLTGGYMPAAATLVTDEVYSAFLGDYAEKRTFFHGHTYTGNPLACAAALASIDVFERETVLESMQPKIERLADRLAPLADMPHVGEVRQRGFMVGIELVRDKTSRTEYDWHEQVGVRVAREVRNHGVILRPLGNVVVIMPPLCITVDQIDTLVDVTARGIEQVTGS